jgi:cell wall-associated NlpC family hydrolase
MSINRMSAAILLVAASIPAMASAPFVATPSCVDVARDTLYSLGLPLEPAWLESTAPTAPVVDPAAVADAAVATAALATVATEAASREILVDVAMKLIDIRYRRGGKAPKTGFDCSGFVKYVFAQALGIDLPGNSAGQYREGVIVPREQLRTGDLVFFQTRGKRVSHVGIYLDNGRFIHSPSTGKRVRIDELRDRYWAKRYLGARRPDTLT